MIILSTNSKHWFTTSFLQLLEEGAGKRYSQCVLSTDYTIAALNNRVLSSCLWLHRVLTTYSSFRCLCSLITQSLDYTDGSLGHPGGCLWSHKALTTYGSFRYLSSCLWLHKALTTYGSFSYVRVSDHTKYWLYVWQLWTSLSCLWSHKALTTYGGFGHLGSCLCLH